MTKKCYTCGETKNIEEFNKNKSKKDGINSICKQCSRERSKKYYKDNSVKHKAIIKINRDKYREINRLFIATYLLTHPCVTCGETDLIVLQFDHIYAKEMSISQAVSTGWSVTRIKKEIKKCQVLCANCHIRKTAKQLNWSTYRSDMGL